MNTAEVIKQAETTIALAKLAEAMRPAQSCDLRLPPGNPDGRGPSREVVFNFTDARAAQAFADAFKAVNEKLRGPATPTINGAVFKKPGE